MTSAIYRNVFRLLLPLLWLLSLCGCTGDMLQDEVVAPSVGGELPVEFEFVLASTRADDDDSSDTTPTDYTLIADRKSFKDKDVIHIEGRFTVVEQNGDESEVIRYGAMSYDSKKGWTAVAESELTWPDKATSGKFTAYYIDISKNNTDGGVLTKGGSTSTYSLTDLTSETDPLKAVGEADSYGHAVKMQFKHLCTYLELRGLGAAVADTYWFTRKGDANALKNSFKLTRNDDNTLKFEFVATEDSWYKNLVYIATKPADGTAAFFLPPGQYGSFTLCYSAVESNYYEYLEYTYVPSEDGEPESPELEAGHSYLLDISKSKGITINTPPQGPEEETWDESNDYIEVDVRAFLEKVANPDDYYCENKDGVRTQILQKESNSQTKLLHNISFKNDTYDFFTNDAEDFFEPIVKQGNVFDGGHHYIKDIARPVFHRNMGTIRNLGLRNIDAEFISDEAEEYGSDQEKKDAHDMSRNGILCSWNERGTISNIRIAGAKIVARVKNDTETEDDRDASQESHNIGCVVGSNTGTITDLALAGTFTLTVEGYKDEYISEKVDASVMIGGIAGQNAENGTITNVGSYDDTELDSSLKSISITNNCSGDIGAFYVGGVAGLSSGYISWVTLPDVTIDGSRSSCVAMYMGGVAGQLSATSSGLAAATTSCTVTGSVKAGTVKKTDKTNTSTTDVTPKSYIGGVAGVLEQSITVCRTAVSVHVGMTANAGVTYATGGAFGRILKTADDISIENIMAYGDALTGPNQYIGNFVGIAPEGKTWEGDYKDHDIVVREYTGYNNIGGNIDKEQ